MTNININLFKISLDGKYLDFIVNCDENYYFTNLELEVRYMANGEWTKQTFILRSLFQDAENNNIINQHSWACRVPLDRLNGISDHGIYIGHFSVINKVYENTEVNWESTIAITSNVNFVYKSLIKHLPSLDDKCTKIDDDLIRNYLLLWAHLEALKLDSTLTTAEYYYKILLNNFSYCNSDLKCGCNDKLHEKRDCGCKR